MPDTSPERYQQYCATFRRVGITPLSYDLWVRSLQPRPPRVITEVQFDMDQERFGGWASGE